MGTSLNVSLTALTEIGGVTVFLKGSIMRPSFENLHPYLALSDARAKLGFWLERARQEDAWLPIMKHRRIVGALIGPRDLEVLDLASNSSATYSEYMRWERRARIEQVNEALELKARAKVREAAALRGE